MYDQEPEEIPSEPMPKTSSDDALRQCAIAFAIDVLGLILLQVLGLHGIILHIIAAGVCHWVDLMRQRNG